MGTACESVDQVIVTFRSIPRTEDRNGSLWGHADEVMAACEQAVALAPDRGNIRDSRGLARALTGDVAGAIDDFEAFVAWTGGDRSRAQRQDWIDALRAGKNPFTREVLERLRG